MGEYASHVEDITRALGDEKIDKKKLEEELIEYLHKYKIELDEAKRSIVKKYGGDPALLTRRGKVVNKLSELLPNEKNIDVVGRIMSVNEKIVEIEGIKKKIYYGILNDGTKSVPYTSWQEPFPYSKGDIIKVKNAYTKEWKGEPQLGFGNFAVITHASIDDLPSIEPGEGKEVKVKEMRLGMAGIVCTVRILEIYKKDVSINGSISKTIIYGRCGDDSGTISFTSWHDVDLSEDDVIRITGAYIKGWKGTLQMTFDERAHIEKLPDDVLPPRDKISTIMIETIENLEERCGGNNVKVIGVCVDLKSGTGLIFRCNECGRVLRSGACGVHGEVNSSKQDLRIKTTIDDGTGTLIAVIGKEITEKILGKSIEDCIQKTMSIGSTDVIEKEIARKILGKPFEFIGNVTKDDFGLMMVVREMKEPSYNISDEVRKIIDERSWF